MNNLPIESKYFPEHYLIPGFEGYLVNRKQEVFRISEGKLEKLFIKYPKNNKGYPSIRTGNKDRLPHLHRVMALAFLPRTSDKQNTVNHKNGIKSDCSVDNLEWISYSENNIHAYEFDLRTDKVKVFVRNVETGVVNEYFSYGDCARKFGIKSSTINWYFKKENRNKLFRGFYQFSLVPDEWPNINFRDIGNFPLGTQVPWLINTKTEVILVDNYKLLKQYLNENNINVVSYKRINDYYELNSLKWDRHIEFQCKMNPNSEGRKPLPIKVTNKVTLEVERFKSLLSFCKRYGYKKSTVQKSVYLKGYYKDFIIEYIRTGENTIRPA